MDYDVVIVGAGAAGLSAAKALKKLGRSFVLVEGSHRIGGRAYSEEIAPGAWFDLGCSYLHQADNNPFVSVADELGHSIGREFGDIFEPSSMPVHGFGQPLEGKDRDRYDRYLMDCYQAIGTAAKAGQDVAIAELIDFDNEFAPIYMAAMAELMTLDLDEISTVDYMATDDGPDFPIKNGYGNLVKAWGTDVPVSLNTRVERIDCRGSGVRVDTSNGSLRAATVLVTVSTGILASQQIEFLPGLPGAKLDAIAGLPCGTENKICLHFDEDIFGPDGRGFHLAWNDEFAGGFEASVMGQDTAIVFTGGRHAVWLEKQGQQAGEDYALNMVASVFGEKVREHLTRSIVTAWTAEPWTLGSYSCAIPGQAHQRQNLAAPINDKLFFAGEATTVGDHACCHGAFNSGQRAAREINAALR